MADLSSPALEAAAQRRVRVQCSSFLCFHFSAWLSRAVVYTAYCLHLAWKTLTLQASASKIFKISQQMMHTVFQEDVLLFFPRSDSSGMFERRPHLRTAPGK